MLPLNLSGYLIIALVLSISGWTIDHMRLDNKVASLQTASATLQATINANAAESIEKARIVEHGHAQALQSINQTLLDTEAKNAKLENDLRIAIGAGSKRLYVRASCPSNSDLPTNPASASGANDAAVELAPIARPDYFSLRSGIESDAAKIIGLQAYARECVRVCGNSTQ